MKRSRFNEQPIALHSAPGGGRNVGRRGLLEGGDFDPNVLQAGPRTGQNSSRGTANLTERGDNPLDAAADGQ